MKKLSIFGFLIVIGLATLRVRLPNLKGSDYPNSLKNLVVKTEDQRFYQHFGIDAIGLGRAIIQTLNGNQQGGSTIQQQLLKLDQNHQNRNIWNKFQEQIGAVLLSIKYSRNIILSSYLDEVPFYHVRGYQQSCNYYFNKTCDKLFDSELLFLIATAQKGTNPYTDYTKISTLTKQLCIKTGVDCYVPEKEKLSQHNDELDPRTKAVLKQYPSQIWNTGITLQIQNLIRANRDLLLQHHAQDCCIIVVGISGQIISYNQCRDYNERIGAVDLCRTHRQTGSAIKPFIYDKAFRKFGYSNNTKIIDEEVSYKLADGSLYQPKNFDNLYHGTVTLAQALGNSFNIPAIKLTDQLGAQTVIDTISQLRKTYGQNTGQLALDEKIFTQSQLGLSVGLGTYELSPLEFARLWGYWYKKDTIKNQIISILSNPLNRVISFGQDNFLNRPNWFVKTGTSRKFVDGWTCGGHIEQEIIVCVWVGNHDVSSMDSASVDTAGYLWYLVTQIVDKGK